jgi:hypothetical protein
MHRKIAAIGAGPIQDEMETLVYDKIIACKRATILQNNSQHIQSVNKDIPNT